MTTREDRKPVPHDDSVQEGTVRALLRARDDLAALELQHAALQRAYREQERKLDLIRNISAVTA